MLQILLQMFLIPSYFHVRSYKIDLVLHEQYCEPDVEKIMTKFISLIILKYYVSP